uniref:Uncharacterized protein n=1 Tax=Coxiella burnetii TaxID=777 RepID=O52885_COXBE|nr:hypothetical protein [Coxiella burnetii]
MGRKDTTSSGKHIISPLKIKVFVSKIKLVILTTYFIVMVGIGNLDFSSISQAIKEQANTLFPLSFLYARTKFSSLVNTMYNITFSFMKMLCAFSLSRGFLLFQ